MVFWQERERICIDYDGLLWERREEPPFFRRLGWAEDEPDLPPELLEDGAVLIDLWIDAMKGDERAEWAHTYYSNLMRKTP